MVGGFPQRRTRLAWDTRSSPYLYLPFLGGWTRRKPCPARSLVILPRAGWGEGNARADFQRAERDVHFIKSHGAGALLQGEGRRRRRGPRLMIPPDE